MTGTPPGRRISVLSRSWWRRDEESFVLRSIAGALSRQAAVDVVTPGAPGTRPDGLFDVQAVGGSAPWTAWPHPDAAAWSLSPATSAVVVLATDDTGRWLAQTMAPDCRHILVGPRAELDPFEVGLPVPINPLAAQRPHIGFGFDGYVLVLSDRSPDTKHRHHGVPTPAASWLIARFPELRMVVVEDATAAAWWGRALRGSVHVDTRADLQRLLAHATVTVDLCPGPLVARECVESLLFGTPIVVPRDSAAERLAREADGLCFGNTAQLLAAVDHFAGVAPSREVGRGGKASAEARHGDPVRFSNTLIEAFSGSGGV